MLGSETVSDRLPGLVSPDAKRDELFARPVSLGL